MDLFMQAVILQALSYGVLLLIAVGFIWFLQGNFLFKFIKVKASRGNLKLVKIREVDHDAFSIGKIEEGFLIFKYAKDVKRIPMSNADNKKNYFYRALGVTWIDYDSEKNAFGLHDYSTVSGHDPIKTQNFLKRILMMSQLKQDVSMIIIILIIVAILAGIGSVVISVQNGNNIASLRLALDTLARSLNSTTAPPPHI